jgi:predicted RNA polymerase sigma factor
MDAVPAAIDAVWRLEAPKLIAGLMSVLEVISLIFNEGYAATSGDDWTRPALCDEALRLGRVLVGLVPADAEVHGLVALMELQASRLRARVGPHGAAILLFDQDRARWDRLLIGRGLAALDRAVALDGGGGFYALQAGIAACHARALTPEATDWGRIAALYGRLAGITRSPIVRLNHAIAVGRSPLTPTWRARAAISCSATDERPPPARNSFAPLC